MSQHVCNRRAHCTDKAKAQVGCRPEYEVSPPSADVCELDPPVFASPSPRPPYKTSIIIIILPLIEMAEDDK